MVYLSDSLQTFKEIYPLAKCEYTEYGTWQVTRDGTKRTHFKFVGKQALSPALAWDKALLEFQDRVVAGLMR